jgi:hypothetical protein
MPPVRAFLIAALLGAAASARAAVLREATGLVQVRTVSSDSWRPAGTLPKNLGEGDGVRTGFNARAKVELSGGSTLEAAGNANFSLESDRPGRASVVALFGSLRLTASAAGGRSVSLRAPTCLVRARGNLVVLRLTVSGGGNATVEVEKGLAGIEDNRGRALLVAEGQRVEVDLAGLREATQAPTPVQARKLDFLSSMRRELGYELGREADFAAASREARRGEHELGRVLTDADGRRVRVEEFVVRPSADRLALVVLNGRPDGLSYFSWDGVFDQALPRNLEPVFAGLAASAGAPTAWTLTSYTATRSNGTDALVERAAGGHQVNVNANADPNDDVAEIFDASRDAYVAAGAVYKTLFDRFGLYVNGTLKRGWTGANLQTYADSVPSTTNDPLTGAALGAALPVVVINSSFPDGASARRATLESYGDGTSISIDDLAVEFSGGTAGRGEFGGATSGNAFRRALLDWRYEQRISIGGTAIRLVMPARDLVITGQLP